MKRILISVTLLASLISIYAYAATYTYTGEYFYEAGAPYTTDMRVTALITTSSPIPPNSTNLDISGILTSWSANDGIQTINNTNGVMYPNVPPTSFSTDTSGNITAGKFTAIISPIGTVVGDTDDFIWISYDLAAKNHVCTHVSFSLGICDEHGFSSRNYGLAEPTGVWIRIADDLIFESSFENLP